MYVCICHDVKDSQIINAINQGINSMEALKCKLDVATCCGCCEPMVQDLLDEYHANTEMNVIATAI